MRGVSNKHCLLTFFIGTVVQFSEDPTILINVSILYLQTLARVIGTVVQFSEDQMKQLIAREDKNFVSNFHHENKYRHRQTRQN